MLYSLVLYSCHIQSQDENDDVQLAWEEKEKLTEYLIWYCVVDV